MVAASTPSMSPNSCLSVSNNSSYFARKGQKGSSPMGDGSVYVGVDVSKSHLDVAVRPTGEFWRVENSEAEIAQLVSRLKELEPTIVVMEATGSYEMPLAAALQVVGVPLRVVNPGTPENLPRRRGSWPRPTLLTLMCSPTSERA